MSVRLNDKFLKGFVTDEEIGSYKAALSEAHDKIVNKTGEGSDFHSAF